MSIKNKLIFTTLGLSTIIFTIVILTWWKVGQQKDDAIVINLAGRQRMLSQKITKEILLFYMNREKTGQENHKLATNVRNSMAIFAKTLAALKDSGEAPISLDLNKTEYRMLPKAKGPVFTQLTKINDMWEEFYGHLETVINKKATSEESLNWILQNNLSILLEMNKAVEMMQERSERKIGTLILGQAAGGATGIFFMVFAFITVGSITGRLKKISTFASQLGTGDLTAKSDFTSRDELGMIGKDLDQMIQNLRKMFLAISKSTNNLNGSSTELASISEQLTGKAGTVSEHSKSVAAAAEEMSSNMGAVAAATEETSTNTNIVSTSTQDMTATINEIAQNTGTAATISTEAVSEAKSASDKVDELGKAAKEIGNVTETITEISEQTNLLALNATIEAARAGEAGKGFAVVANEIKELARQTADATKEIKEKIVDIQVSTDDTVTQIQQISKVIHQVNEIVDTIAAAVEEQSATTNEIGNNVAQASQGIQEVTENVAQASSVSGEVARDITEVHQAADDMSGSISQVNMSANALSSLAEELDEMVGHFKV